MPTNPEMDMLDHENELDDAQQRHDEQLQRLFENDCVELENLQPAI